MSAKVIFFKKLALLLGYALFSGWSAYFTATSIQHKWFSNVPFFLPYIIVFIFALLAGYFLKVAIKEIKNHINPSRGKFFGALIAFIIFWGFSFATNVHYFIVSQHGYDNLTAQVESCKAYYKNMNNASDENASQKKEELKAQIQTHWIKFQNSLQDSRESYQRIGDECISELKAIENCLTISNTIYGDNNSYQIWDPKHHQEFTKKLSYNDFGKVQELFQQRIDNAFKRKCDVIDKHFSSMGDCKDAPKINAEADAILKNLSKLAEGNEGLSFDDLYKCYRTDVTHLLKKMPAGYEKWAEANKIYPSDRMFDFTNVWMDKFTGKLPDYIGFWGAVPMALLFDLSGFILIAL